MSGDGSPAAEGKRDPKDSKDTKDAKDERAALPRAQISLENVARRKLSRMED